MGADLTVISKFSQVKQKDAGGSTTDAFARTYAMSLKDGNGSLQANVFFRDHQTLTNTSITYSLSALPSGDSCHAISQLYLEVVSPAGTTGSGTIGPGSSGGWTNGLGGNIPIGPLSNFNLSIPDVSPLVVATTNDTITITVTGTLEFYLSIVGKF